MQPKDSVKRDNAVVPKGAPAQEGVPAEKLRSPKIQHAFPDRSFEELQRRIREQISKLNVTEYELSLRAGFHHSYFSDLVNAKPGKTRKKSLSHAYLPRAAAVLECDEEYLTLKQSTPRRAGGKAQPKIIFGGYLKAGAWDNSSKGTAFTTPPSVLEPGFDIDIAYSQEDETLAGIGVHAGMVLYCKRDAKSKIGDVVVVKRTAKNAMELSAQVKTEAGYERRPLPGAAPVKAAKGLQFDETEVAVVRLAQLRLK